MPNLSRIIVVAARRRSWLPAAVTLLASGAFAADPPAKEDLTSSVRFEQDRPAEQLLARSQAATGRGDLTQAVALLQQVLDGGADRLVLTDGVYRNGADEANRRLVELSAAGLAAYERHSGAAARAALAQASNPQRLLDVAVRYRHTRAGTDALRRLAQQWMDTGRFAEAALAYAAIIEQAANTDDAARSNPDVVVGWCAALLSAGEQTAARGVRDRFQAIAERQLEALFTAQGATAAVEPEQPLPHDLADILPTSFAPLWVTSTLPAAIDRSILDDLLVRLDDSSVPAMTCGQLFPLPDGVVIRAADAVICVDAGTGGVRWRHDALLPGAGPFSEYQDPQSTVERLFGDGASSALTGDRERMYFIAPPAAVPFDGGRPVPGAAQVKRGPRLVAVNLDGHVEWEVGTGVESRPATGDPGGSDFFAELVAFQGPPAPFESRLYLIAERSETLHLVVLEPTTGRVLSTTTLGAVDAAAGRDDRRHVQHCRPAFAGGLVICPTGAGTLVAVDRLTGTIRWARRYPREPIRTRPKDEQDLIVPPQVHWPGGWRDLTLITAGPSRVLLASPESDMLRALDAQTGRLAWQQPRGDGMYLAGVFGDKAVIVGRRSVRAYDVSTGGESWNTPVEQPVGRGFATPTHYVLPIESGGVAAAELATGAVRQTFPGHGAPPWLELRGSSDSGSANQPRNLVWLNGAVIAQSPLGVSRLTNLGETLTAANAAVDQSDQAAAPLESLARLRRESGDFEGAAAAAQRRYELRAGSDGAEAAARDLLETLWWVLDRSNHRDELEQRIMPLLAGSRDRMRYEYARFAAASTDTPSEFVQCAFAVLDQFDEPVFAQLDDGERWVRLDRLVQSRLTSARERLQPAQQAAFDKQLDAALSQRLDGSGDLEAARWADLLVHLPQGQRLRLQIEPQWSSVREFTRTQLRLAAQAAAAEPPLAAAALSSLAELFEQHQDLDDAAAAFRELGDRFGAVTFPDGTPVATLLQQIPGDSPLGRRLVGARPAVWPQGTPTVSVRPWPEGEIYFVPVPVSTNRGGMFERLNMAVDRIGTTVRFAGAGFSRPWALTLPRSGSNSRLATAAPDLRRAWAFGQMFVLQVGTDVFGIAPFDAAGEPGVTLLWPPAGERISATDTPIPRQGIVEAITPRRRPADFDGPKPRIDPLGHRVGQVGPVCAGYFCVLRRGVLTAFDTATGEELWSRRNLPPGASCCGDDHHVIVISETEARREVLQVIDGKRLQSFAAGYSPEQVLLTSGSRILLETGGVEPSGVRSPYALTLWDLVADTAVWKAEFPAGSACFPVDGPRCGVLGPDGTITLLRLDDGQPIARHSVETPQQMVRVLAFVDPDSIHVIVSGPPSDPAFPTPAGGVHLNEGYRRATVNGTWHAFERDSGALRWSRAIENASLLLDQALDVPLLVFNEHIYPPDSVGQGTLVQRVRCFDRRTGELLYESQVSAPHNYFVVERDEAAGWVDLRLPGQIVRFDYAPRAR